MRGNNIMPGASDTYGHILWQKENREQRDHDLKKTKIKASAQQFQVRQFDNHNINENYNRIHNDADVIRAQNSRYFKQLEYDKENKNNELIRAGVLTYRDGKYHTDKELFEKYNKNIVEIEKNSKRENHITQMTNLIASKLASFFAIGSVNKKFIRKHIEKRYDKKEMKNLKKKYKQNKKIKGWEKRFGKLS